MHLTIASAEPPVGCWLGGAINTVGILELGAGGLLLGACGGDAGHPNGLHAAPNGELGQPKGLHSAALDCEHPKGLQPAIAG